MQVKPDSPESKDFSKTASSSGVAVKCPACSELTTGRFCSHCGTPLAETRCEGCGAPLAKGARFCADCGTGIGVGVEAAASATAPGRMSSRFMPWAVGVVAIVAVLVLSVAQRSRSGVPDSPVAAQPIPQPADAGAPQAGTSVQPGLRPGSASDISSLTPQQQADRLFKRIMRLHAEGKTDSVQFFVPMVLMVYQTLAPLGLDQWYDLGTVANAAGIYAVERAQADSMLRVHPTHLLGLALASRSSRALGDLKRAASYERKLLAVSAAELKTQRPEYLRHRNDIDAALDRARLNAPK